jgi:hypothetical protein
MELYTFATNDEEEAIESMLVPLDDFVVRYFGPPGGDDVVDATLKQFPPIVVTYIRRVTSIVCELEGSSWCRLDVHVKGQNSNLHWRVDEDFSYGVKRKYVGTLIGPSVMVLDDRPPEDFETLTRFQQFMFVKNYKQAKNNQVVCIRSHETLHSEPLHRFARVSFEIVPMKKEVCI